MLLCSRMESFYFLVISSFGFPLLLFQSLRMVAQGNQSYFTSHKRLQENEHASESWHLSLLNFVLGIFKRAEWFIKKDWYLWYETMPALVFLSPKSLCIFAFVIGLILEKVAPIPITWSYWWHSFCRCSQELKRYECKCSVRDEHLNLLCKLERFNLTSRKFSHWPIPRLESTALHPPWLSS